VLRGYRTWFYSLLYGSNSVSARRWLVLSVCRLTPVSMLWELDRCGGCGGCKLVVGLGSLAYPSVQVTVFRTETFSNTSSYAYSVAVFTAVLVPYSTTRALHSYCYEPGNFPGCDPTAMGCNYGFPNYAYYASSMSTYSGLSTSSYQATMTTQSTITSTLTKTSYNNIPMYTTF